MARTGPAASAAVIASGIAADLQALGTPERAVSERTYLKSDRIHYGTSVPHMRTVCKRFLRQAPDLTHDELLAVCDALWAFVAPDDTGRRVPVHERRMAAVELFDLRTRLLSAADLDVLERLVRESGTWALVDTLASHVVATIVAADPSALAVLDRWVVDPDFWIRRSAVLGLSVLLREGHELDRFFAYADALLPEREFFVRKVLGWVARETAKRHPDDVSAWLRRNMSRMNGVTIREAVKHLPDGAALLATWKATPAGR
ncbi:MAG: alkylation repair enzyme [Ilumatobacteraceae bacterium]|nr:alkylation repair enzyme [Ilumatobacteraceae bacterium]